MGRVRALASILIFLPRVKPLRETARGAETRTDVQSGALLLPLSLSLSLSRRRNAYRNCVTMATVMSECGYDAVVGVARQ